MDPISRHITAGLLYVSGSNVIQRGFSTLSFLITVKYLSLSDYGLMVLLLSFTSPVIAFVTGGLNGVIGAEISLARGKKDFASMKAFLVEYLTFNMVAFVAFALLALFFRDLFIGWQIFDPTYALYLVPLLLYIFFQILVNYTGAIVKSYEYFKEASLVGAAEPFSRLAALVVLLLFYEITLATAFSTYIFSKFFAAFLSSLLSLKLYSHIARQEGAPRWGTLFRIVRTYGKWGIVEDVVSQFRESAKVWLIGLFLNTESIAIFNVGAKMVSIVTKFFSLQSVIQPIIARKVDDRAIVSSIIIKARKYYGLFMLCAAAGLWVGLPFLLPFFLPEYADSYIYFAVLALQLPLGGLIIGQMPILLAFRRQRFLFVQSLVMFAFNIGVSAVGLHFFGLMGLVVGVLAGYVVGFLLRELYIRRWLGFSLVKVKSFVTFDEYDRMLLAAMRGGFARFKIF